MNSGGTTERLVYPRHLRNSTVTQHIDAAEGATLTNGLPKPPFTIFSFTKDCEKGLERSWEDENTTYVPSISKKKSCVRGSVGLHVSKPNCSTRAVFGSQLPWALRKETRCCCCCYLVCGCWLVCLYTCLFSLSPGKGRAYKAKSYKWTTNTLTSSLT